jgi:beta-N-acetylhexosaminidase
MTIRVHARLLSALVLSAGVLSCVRAPQPARAPLPAAALEITDEAWVRSTLADMSLEERVGQMLMLPLDGRFENVRGPAMKQARVSVDEIRVGGFLIGPGAPLDIAVKLNELQSSARLPLLIAADPEWGAGLRMWHRGAESDATIFPYPMGAAATGDPGVAELVGRVIAREARAVGVHWLFSPVLDIGADPGDVRINVRGFGSDAGVVGSFGAAWIRGATSGGVLTAVRHFPGLEPVEADENGDGPRMLRPFRAAIGAGVSGVTVGHAAVPGAGDASIPATLSSDVAGTLLRRDLGFGGIVMTEAMTSTVLSDVSAYSPGELVVRAVEAGADIVLAPPDPALAHRALLSAVRSGRLHYSRVDSSVARILRAKARVGLHRERTVSLDSVLRIVGAPEHDAVARDIAARSLTLARDSAGVLPLDPRRVRELALIVVSQPGTADAGTVLAEELMRIYGRGITTTRLDAHSSRALHDSAVARAARADAAVLAIFAGPDGDERMDELPPSAPALSLRLGTAARRLAVVSFGDPFAAARLPGAATYLLAWQRHGDASQRAAAHAIAGRAPITGRLPVTIPAPAVGSAIEAAPIVERLTLADPASVGMDPVALARVDSIILAGIVNGAAPGVAIAIGRHGRLVRLRGYGNLDRRRGYAAVTDSSIYDLASITKVVATTTALMMLVDGGLIRLDDPVRKHIPEWRGSADKERVTLRNLLLHNAGLAAYGPLWRELKGREQYRRRIAAMSLEYEPGTRTVYSDFGVILLGLIIEQVSGQTLDTLLRDRLFGPLELRDTGFNPLEWPYGTTDIDGDADRPRAAADPLMARIAPTEIDTVYRMRHIRGQVHDENAFALGGVAGHAGLFSSARDMAVFAQMMLNGGYYGGRRFIDPATIQQFTARQGEQSSRALGWDTPVAGSSAGDYFSASSFGHTGFTGPSIWIDPERDLYVVLLMNRVNPTRDNQRHLALRRDVADAVQRAITDMPVQPRDRN